MGGVKTKWMLFWLISLNQNVASIGSLKDDSCTPKPAKLNACNTSQSDLMKSRYFRCAFFFQTLPKSLHFTCSPQVCLGLVRMTTHTATGQVDSWTKLPGRPRLEPVLQVSPNALYSQGTQRNSKVRTTALNGRWKKMVGRYDD